MDDKWIWDMILLFTIYFWTKENVNALFNYCKSDITEVKVLDFVSTEGRLFERKYFCLVEIKGIKYLVRRSVMDRVGKTIKVFPSRKYNNNLKKPVCYRTNFVLVYVDIFQLSWFVIAMSCAICYYITGS